MKNKIILAVVLAVISGLIVSNFHLRQEDTIVDLVNNNPNAAWTAG